MRNYYEWDSIPESDIHAAEDDACAFLDNYTNIDHKEACKLDCLIAITKVLVQIRDELRKMNGGKDDGNT